MLRNLNEIVRSWIWPLGLTLKVESYKVRMKKLSTLRQKVLQSPPSPGTLGYRCYTLYCIYLNLPRNNNRSLNITKTNNVQCISHSKIEQLSNACISVLNIYGTTVHNAPAARWRGRLMYLGESSHLSFILGEEWGLRKLLKSAPDVFWGILSPELHLGRGVRLGEAPEECACCIQGTPLTWASSWARSEAWGSS